MVLIGLRVVKDLKGLIGVLKGLTVLSDVM